LDPERLIARCAPLHARLRIQFVPKPFAVRDILKIIKRAAAELEQVSTESTGQAERPVYRAAARSTRHRRR
jgi:hypothetical protein